MPADLFTCPADAVDEVLVRGFVTVGISSHVQAEGLLVEFKKQNDGGNVIYAVAAMANTDGGLVFVGVDEKAQDPIVGITTAQADAIVQQLRALLPDAMPEVISVALSDLDGRLVMILRVDPDRVDHPVVVNGRVLIRMPGHTIGARRSEILALAQRSVSHMATGYAGFPVDVARLPMWEEEERPPAEVRVHARFVLPRRAYGRQYLGTPALHAALAALESGPIPRHLRSEHLRHPELRPSGWRQIEVAALRGRFRSELNPPGHRGPSAFQASAFLALASRQLDVVLSIAILDGTGDYPAQIGDVEAGREFLLAGVVSAVATGVSCAEGMGAGEPMASPRLTAWIGGESGVGTMRVDLQWPQVEKQASLTEWRFNEMQPAPNDIRSFDEVVRLWLVPLVFELGSMGFEERLAELPLPNWARAV